MLRWQSDREDYTLIIRKAAQFEEMAREVSQQILYFVGQYHREHFCSCEKIPVCARIFHSSFIIPRISPGKFS